MKSSTCYLSKIYFLCFLLTKIFGQTVQIGLMPQKNIEQFKIRVEQGSYIIPELKDMELDPDAELLFSIQKNQIYLQINSKNYKKLDQISLYHSDEIAAFSFLQINGENEKKIRKYYGDLIVNFDNNKLFLIQQTDINDYLEGVVQAEAGFNHHPEFYKTQAIISRTYAYRNWLKHQKEGYNLCDQVHCQAYKGILMEDPIILDAVRKTDSWVVVDKNLQLIEALYYANSGGETVHSEHYWSNPVEYLRSIKDEFSIGQPNYRWEKKIKKKDFYQYLSREFNLPFSEEEWLSKLQHQNENRTTHLGDPALNIPLKRIRTDWNLRSTFFHLEDHNDEELLFLGKGYGHGVGLSQEGAMNMAKKGYHHFDILRYYYKNTQIIQID